MDNHLLDRLVEACGTPTAPIEELRSALHASCLTLEAFGDAFAHRIATRYLAGTLDFDAANNAINGLAFFAFQPPDLEPGPYMWSIYHAFDTGEHVHPGDSPDPSPAERYTRPRLLSIMAGRDPDPP
jgi:hypothetical protein